MSEASPGYLSVFIHSTPRTGRTPGRKNGRTPRAEKAAKNAPGVAPVWRMC